MTSLSALGLQIALVTLVLLATFSGPVIAVWLLARRKRLVRAERRSPIGIDLLRPPGHALREKIEDLRLDVMGDVMGLCILPSLVLTVYLAQAYLMNTPTTLVRSGTAAAIALGCVAVLIKRLLRSSAQLDNLRLGLDAEMAVGQELDQLMKHGASVFHDVPADNFNIDHVVVAPQGIFAIETKGFSKRGDLKGRSSAHVSFDGRSLQFPGWTTSEPIDQADRQAKWLASWIAKATACATPVQAVLALPGWFVEQQGPGPVEVYSGKQLKDLLRRKISVSLSPDTLQRLNYQLEQRCRDVVPTYRA